MLAQLVKLLENLALYLDATRDQNPQQTAIFKSLGMRHLSSTDRPPAFGMTWQSNWYPSMIHTYGILVVVF